MEVWRYDMAINRKNLKDVDRFGDEGKDVDRFVTIIKKKPAKTVDSRKQMQNLMREVRKSNTGWN